MQTKNSQDLSSKLDKFRNYSKEDGHSYKKIENKKLTLKRGNKVYCPNCKTKNSLNSLYCKSCGCSLESIVEKKDKLDFKYIKSNIDFRNSFKVAIFSSLILFVISFISKIFINLSSESILLSQMTTSDVFLLLNGGLLSGATSMGMGMGFGYDSSYEFYLQVNSIILVIIPILSIILSYRFLSKNRERALSDILGVGISYAVILAIVAILFRNSLSFGDGFFSTYTIAYEISAISVLVRGFVIGFLGVLISNMKLYKDNLVFNILKLALKTIGIGYVICLVILLIGSLININYIGELTISALNLNPFILFIQLAVYLWHFANCIPMMIAGKNLAIANLFSSYLSIELKLILLSLVAISALVLFVAGTKLNRIDNKETGKKTILMFSGIYSLLMGALALFTTINMNLSNVSGATLQIGVSVVLAIGISFLYSFIMSYVGFKLNIWDE